MRLSLLLLVCAAAACAKSPRPSMPGAPRTQTSSSSPAAAAATGAPPASFVRTTSDARSMRTVEVREGLNRQTAMRTLVDALSQRFVVDVVDQRAGFVMTSWQANVMRDGVPDLRYRTRFTARFTDEWRALQLHSEARWSRGEEPDVGYDAAQLDTVTTELRAKLGRKP